MTKKKEAALLKSIVEDRNVRREITRKSHRWFFSVFLSHYMTHKIALFHEEMFRLTEDTEHKLIVVMAFRGSGKSTIMNLSYALWSILGVQEKRFVLIVSKTQSQAKGHLNNIRNELEHNDLLKIDLGPFETDETSWGTSSLVLTKMDARIMATSREQSIRGIRHGQHRPDLIICDDIEDSLSVRMQEDRDTAYQWLMSEIMAAGDINTNVIVLGNLLHGNSLLMRLRDYIALKTVKGIFKTYPLLDDNGRILWQGKFSKKDIRELEGGVPDSGVWEREYLLRYTSEHQRMPFLRSGNGKGRETPEKNPYPTQTLGKYQISTPKESFRAFAEIIRRLQEEDKDRDDEES